jgi:arylsulfatase B
MRRSIDTLMVLVGFPALAQPPNILLIIADDLGLDPTPGYLPGPTKAAMPHLESLMASGLTFDNAWANPLCSPTRATIISGKYGASTNVLNVQELSTLDLSETTVFEYLQQINSGYDASVIGKWHLGGEVSTLTDPNDQGVPHYTGLLSGGVQNYFNWMQTTDGVQATNGNYITQVLTDSALAWINSRTEPWFCWLAYTAPHVPLHRPPLFMHEQGPLSTEADSISAHPLPYFMAMIESLDFSLGRIMDSVPTDVLANTVIIFIGDNGTDGPVIQAPYDADHAKGSLYEGGVRVPLVITGPGVTRHNEREAALVNSTDLFATIVELTGHPLPQYEQSKSLLPLFTQTGIAHRTCLRTEVSGQMDGGYALRNAQYKVIVKTNGDQEFYDLLTDPFEANDLLLGSLTSEQQQALDQLLSGCDITALVEEHPRGTLLLHPVPASTLLFVDGTDGKSYRIASADGGWTGSGVVRHGVVDVSGLPPGGYSLSIGMRHATFLKVE